MGARRGRALFVLNHTLPRRRCTNIFVHRMKNMDTSRLGRPGGQKIFCRFS